MFLFIYRILLKIKHLNFTQLYTHRYLQWFVGTNQIAIWYLLFEITQVLMWKHFRRTLESGLNLRKYFSPNRFLVIERRHKRLVRGWQNCSCTIIAIGGFFSIKYLLTRCSHWTYKCAFSISLCFESSKWVLIPMIPLNIEYYLSCLERRSLCSVLKVYPCQSIAFLR